MGMGELLTPTWSTVKVGSGMLSLKELCYSSLDSGGMLHLKWMVEGCLCMMVGMESLGHPMFGLERLGNPTTRLRESWLPTLDLRRSVHFTVGQRVAWYPTLEDSFFTLAVEGVWNSTLGFEGTWPHTWRKGSICFHLPMIYLRFLQRYVIFACM